MPPIYRDIPTIELKIKLPDLAGLEAILQNIIIWNDCLAAAHPVSYFAACVLLLTQPILFTVPFIIIGAILRIPCVILKAFVRRLGFGRETGIEADSFAARYQSRYYGATIPPNSYFSRAQSYGALGDEWDADEQQQQGVSLPLYARVFQILTAVALIRFIFF
ncbi:hypothetical protein CYLTODRAFT_484870 [Cylindrobasidium torrendii FP15055 ss-10]|uniref:Uncharacterized protein n=1 Tax=Cylindrobasidium torrendii FP15055 ss-10 TaxID=1314674 RepID=A0A0D7BUA8_9AGAR|nr:hypothetical protein CYLTODRAFT_484870 [Cylindrobasidium torrendii FP15055 ss-10]